MLRNKLNDRHLLEKCWKRIYASKNSTKRVSSKGADNISLREFQDNEESQIDLLYHELSTKNYKQIHLLGHPVKKENGKYRLISAPAVRDRIVHKAMLSILNPLIYPYINTNVSYCGVKKNIWNRKDTDALTTKKAFLQIIKHVRNKNFYFFKSDIKGFYDNVPKRKFMNVITKLLDKELKDTSLLPLIKALVYFRISNPEIFNGPNSYLKPKKFTGICQGSALSQFFANIYLINFDHQMKSKFQNRYIRYVDDFIVLCETIEEAKFAKVYSANLLKKLRLELSEDLIKTKYGSIKNDYAVFLGIRIDSKLLSYKKNKANIQKHIRQILDENNQELYGHKGKDIILSMNNKIKGLEEYLKYYHTHEAFDEMNKWIRQKRKGAFKELHMFDKSKIKPLVTRKEWQSFFK